ncbi:MAG TPA: AMP-binding protein [Rhizomicrobium sp.]|jgi:crotonobetaine/carnitine-CoA ligase
MIPTASRFHPFAGRDLPWLVDAQAEHLADKVFLIWEPFNGPSQSWTYAQFAAETRRYAAGLHARGIAKGDFVTIHLENCPEFLFAWYACSRVGAIAVTTNTRSAQEELEYFVSHSCSVAAITQPKFAGMFRKLNLRWIACTERDGAEAPQTPRPSDTTPFEELRGDEAQAPVNTPDPMAPNSVQYTSGTTSRPKGVVWTQANALWSARVNATHAQLTKDDVHIVYFPLFHTNALAWSMLATLWSGGTAVLLPRFSASRFWEISLRHRCTWANVVLFTLRALEKQPIPEKHYYRLWGGAGDIGFVRDIWGIKTIGWYGMTETVSQCIASERTFRGPEFSMGYPVPEYQISIRRDDGSEVAFGETGNIWIKGISGLSLFKEYLNNPEATADSYDENGWFETGDQVTPLENGHVFFSGRAKDMLKVGAENVAALEIEAVILRAPGVMEAAVVGRPDPMLDEVPVAFVVAKSPGPDLAATIHGLCNHALADFKRPRDLIFVDELPKGLMDKVLKKELRARLVSRDS